MFKLFNKSINKDKAVNLYTDSDFDPSLVKDNSDLYKNITQNVFRNMKSYVHPSLSYVFFKYSIIFVFAATLSLFLCPQKGFGFLNHDYPLFFHFLHKNLLVCGLYCGLFFASLTHLLSLSLMTHFERLKLNLTLTFVPHIWFAIFFGFLMMVGDSHYNLSLAYNVGWILAVLAITSWNWSKFLIFKHHS